MASLEINDVRDGQAGWQSAAAFSLLLHPADDAFPEHAEPAAHDGHESEHCGCPEPHGCG